MASPGEDLAAYPPKQGVRYSGVHPTASVYVHKALCSNLSSNKNKQNLPDLVPSEQSSACSSAGTNGLPTTLSHATPTLHLYTLLSELLES